MNETYAATTMPLADIRKREPRANAPRVTRRDTLPADVLPNGTPNLVLPIHPGEILALEYMESLGLTAYQLHKATGMTETHLSQIMHGRRGITASAALRLGAALGTSAELWMNLQSGYELKIASAKLRKELAAITVLSE